MPLFDDKQLPQYRAPWQKWILHSMESPYHFVRKLRAAQAQFNLTMTYISDSDVMRPYGDVIALTDADWRPPPG